MLVLTWNRCCVVVFLVASLKTGTSQVSEARPKANLIKPALSEESPTPATNRTAHTGITKKHNALAQVYPCSNDKECSVGSYCHSPQQSPPRCLNCRRRKKRCHRDAMCCPGNRCSNFICVPISESVLSPHISALDEDNKLSTKTRAGGRMEICTLSTLSKDTRATLACVPPTARRATAAPAISGPKSASRC
ncbi:Dickkopf-related protein 2 [Dissostichus eleginoides]|uniref:Dickkopf-related protein 2 n=1 Tax=Dissostichus eleginoides TaxID=100907 RepID=A0AAD9BNN0_DISEL|nr:Dickkopf-related protein 2 [Dissostichus eleginoides]